MAVEPIRYHELKPKTSGKHLPNIPYHHLERALMVAAIGCAILSLIPSLRMIGAISLRSVSCMVAGMQLAHSFKKREGGETLLLRITCLVSVALGLAGVIAHSNALIFASLATNIALQALEAGRGTYEKDLYKAGIHISFIVVDTFMTISFLTGSWHFMMVTASINNLAILAISGIKVAAGVLRGDSINMCYLGISLIGLACIVNLEYPKTVTSNAFRNMPIGPSAFLVQEPRLRRVERPLQKQMIVSEALDTFTQPVRPLLLFDCPETIGLIHKSTAQRVKINLTQAHASTLLRQDTYLSLDKKTFDRLITFFKKGAPGNLTKLKEKELLALYNAADDLEIERLRAYCQTEVALRLKHFEWSNTSLFVPYTPHPRPINALLELFDFGS